MWASDFLLGLTVTGQPLGLKNEPQETRQRESVRRRIDFMSGIINKWEHIGKLGGSCWQVTDEKDGFLNRLGEKGWGY